MLDFHVNKREYFKAGKKMSLKEKLKKARIIHEQEREQEERLRLEQIKLKFQNEIKIVEEQLETILLEAATRGQKECLIMHEIDYTYGSKSSTHYQSVNVSKILKSENNWISARTEAGVECIHDPELKNLWNRLIEEGLEPFFISSFAATDTLLNKQNPIDLFFVA